jgi:hypothetical protein
MLNQTLPFADKLPPMDFVVLHHWTSVASTWQREMMRVAAQPQTQFLNLQWFLQADFDSSQWYNTLYQLPKEYSWSNFSFTAEQKTNFEPQPRQNLQFPVNRENLLCARDGVLASQKPRLFSGWHSAQSYREKLFGLVGVPMPPPKGITKGLAKPNFSGKVLIDFRGWNEKRNWINHDVFAEMVRYYGLTPVIVQSYSKFGDYESQMRQVSEVDVYAIVHGAGVANEILMAPRSTLIEIFPYGMRVPMYKYLASMLNVNYIEVVSFLKGGFEWGGCGSALHTGEFFTRCQNFSSMASNLNWCTIPTKRSCVLASLPLLEEALISAYDYIGVNLNTRVDELFSSRYAHPHNDFHTPDNFIWY